MGGSGSCERGVYELVLSGRGLELGGLGGGGCGV